MCYKKKLYLILSLLNEFYSKSVEFGGNNYPEIYLRGVITGKVHGEQSSKII